ncbi:MAG: hypothetical protein UR12_C0024G0010 [candidate division TM6 bacterium GW2011_GWF2_30_66]|nr:MAG: hypothetical protein UR12_C0024G0010 [candidate division TM6 bacterium GW2011_GWF2_30_66]
MKFFRSKFIAICFFVSICFQYGNFYAFSFNSQASKVVSRNIFDKKKLELVIKKVCEKKYLILSSVFGAVFVGAAIVFLKKYFSDNPDDPKGSNDPKELDDLKMPNDSKELGLSGENSPDIALPIEQKDDNIKVVVEDLKAKDDIINTEIKKFVGDLIDQVNLNVNSENDLANLEVKPDFENVVDDKEPKLEQIKKKRELKEGFSKEKIDSDETEDDGENSVVVLIKKDLPEEKKAGKDTLKLLLMINEQGGEKTSEVDTIQLHNLIDEQMNEDIKVEKTPEELEKDKKEEEILGNFIDNELKNKKQGKEDLFEKLIEEEKRYSSGRVKEEIEKTGK